MTKNYKTFYEGKTILVTGGAGAIGGNLARELASIGAEEIIVLDNLSSGTRFNIPSLPNVLFVKGSILDEEKLNRVFSEEPEVVFHLAALFGNQNSIDHPESDLLINGLGTLKTLRYAHLAKVDRFIYTSSGCAIYGNNYSPPLKEEARSLQLNSPYQITKLLGELYSNFFRGYYGLKTVCPRLFNVYGPGELPGQYRNVITNFIYWAMLGKPLIITGTGEETRDFTFVSDVVDGLLRAGAKEEAIGEAFNLASGQETKIIDLANMINDLIGNTAGISYAEKRKWDKKERMQAPAEHAHNLIGYEPKTSLKNGLEKTVKWFEENWEWIKTHHGFEPGMSSAVRSYWHSS